MADPGTFHKWELFVIVLIGKTAVRSSILQNSHWKVFLEKYRS